MGKKAKENKDVERMIKPLDRKKKLLTKDVLMKKSKKISLDDEMKEKALVSKLAYEDHRQRKESSLAYERDYSTMETAVFSKDHDDGQREYIIGSRGTCLGCSGSKDPQMRKENKKFTSILENVKTGTKDLTTDILLALGLSHLSNRYHDLHKLVEKIEKDHPSSKIVLTGHSLGGRLAYNIGRKRGHESIVFNPGTTPIDFLAGNWPSSSKQRHRVISTKGDIVSHFRDTSSVQNLDDIVEIKPKKGIHPHSIDNFIDDVVDKIE
jgi:hypothetical protein